MKCYKSTYKKFGDLNKMIKFFKLNENEQVLYQRIILEIIYNHPISIPSEIGQLVNLQRLNLLGNKITSMPYLSISENCNISIYLAIKYWNKCFSSA